ncbi:hypothetical protein ACHQM5_027663 [Ranunculus cassubicifolius]
MCLSSTSESNVDEEDKLGNLPEPILHHILSFLDTRRVIQTTLLSRKWRYLWAHVPFVSFSRSDFHDTPKCQHRSFCDFITTALSLRRSSTMLKFEFESPGTYCNPCNIMPWVSLAVEANVQELHLQFLSYDNVRFVKVPHCLFTCKSLTSLRLDLGDNKCPVCVEVPLPDSINLPVLNYLCLGSIRKMSTEFLDKFFSGSPVLEKLEIFTCEFEKANSIIISAAQLKHLTIELFEKARDDNDRDYSARRIAYYGCTDNCDVTISAPNLVSLLCTDYAYHVYSLENLFSLEKASIEKEILNGWSSSSIAPTYDHDFTPVFTIQDSNRMIKCINGLYTVKSLRLNHIFLKVVSVAGGEVLKTLLTPFTNLRYLELSTAMTDAHLQAMNYLLQGSHSVKTLVIDIIPKREKRGNKQGKLEDNVVYIGEEFLLKHLERIEVRDVKGSANELEFLKILLKNVVELEKMIISISKDFTTKHEERLNIISDELLTCPRGSSNVEIVFRKS